MTTDESTPETTQATAAAITRTTQGFMIFWCGADGVWYSRRILLGARARVGDTTYAPGRVYGQRASAARSPEEARHFVRAFDLVREWSPLAATLLLGTEGPSAPGT